MQLKALQPVLAKTIKEVDEMMVVIKEDTVVAEETEGRFSTCGGSERKSPRKKRAALHAGLDRSNNHGCCCESLTKFDEVSRRARQ